MTPTIHIYFIALYSYCMSTTVSLMFLLRYERATTEHSDVPQGAFVQWNKGADESPAPEVLHEFNWNCKAVQTVTSLSTTQNPHNPTGICALPLPWQLATTARSAEIWRYRDIVRTWEKDRNDGAEKEEKIEKRAKRLIEMKLKSWYGLLWLSNHEGSDLIK